MVVAACGGGGSEAGLGARDRAHHHGHVALQAVRRQRRAAAGVHARDVRVQPALRRSDRFAELDATRDLVRREVARAVIDDLLGAALLLRDDARDDHRARHRIGDDRGLRGLDLRERLEAALDLAERDALAVDLDDVVLAAGELQAAVLVELAEVAGAQPAALVDRRRSRPCPTRARPSAAARRSNGPIDFGDSVLLLTQIRPSLPPVTGLPSGPVIFTSTPSIGLPTVVGYLPVSSSAIVAASVEW